MINNSGEMILSMSELQEYAKAMLKNVISIFVKNKIPYFACFGTALGAVRHGDIIPWDRDIDLAVPIIERERMIEALKRDLSQEYRLWTASDDNYALTFTRVALNGKRHELLHIDIYNIIGLPDDLREQRRAMDDAFRINNLIHNKYYLHFSENSSFLERIRVTLLMLQSSLVIEKRLRTQFEKILHKWNYDSANYITVPIKVYGMKKVFKKEIFGKGVEMAFGSISLNIPECYDFYLTQIYGDYMTFPPQEERDSMMERKWKIENL